MHVTCAVDEGKHIYIPEVCSPGFGSAAVLSCTWIGLAAGESARVKVSQ